MKFFSMSNKNDTRPASLTCPAGARSRGLTSLWVSEPSLLVFSRQGPRPEGKQPAESSWCAAKFRWPSCEVFGTCLESAAGGEHADSAGSGERGSVAGAAPLARVLCNGYFSGGTALHTAAKIRGVGDARVN